MFILPSYNRPEKCAQAISQMKKTGVSTRGLLFLNGGDKEGYHNIDLPRGWEWYVSDKNLGVCGALNKVFELFPNEPFYGLICDDEFVQTEEWDKKLSEAAGDWMIAHGNDNWRSDKRIHGVVALGGELVRTLGWIALPGLWHWFVDNTWEVLASECRLEVYLKDVVMEHRHWMNGKGTADAVHLLGESRAREDHAVFVQWLKTEAPWVIAKIKKKMLCNQKS